MPLLPPQNHVWQGKYAQAAHAGKVVDADRCHASWMNLRFQEASAIIMNKNGTVIERK
jgi:hypothetical protein